ncbi:MAG: DHHA1 domain-containing protein [Candidatus Paceibacterota bacterium]|jgi:oligoribonuclease NrnB/cAMP/cGMP phosphodiesterase (DHH superfamily)
MKVFYHHDLDGQCAAAIVFDYYKNNTKVDETASIEFISINHGQPFPWDSLERNEIVYMLDFSLKINDMIKLDNLVNLVWIDHHITAINDFKKAEHEWEGSITLKDGLAGCELTWEYFYDDIIPDAIYYVGCYDVWRTEEYPTAEYAYYALLSKDTNPKAPIWDIIINSAYDHGDEEILFMESLLHDGETIVKYKNKYATELCQEYAFDAKFEGLNAIVLNSGRPSSPLFQSVYDPAKHDIMLAFCYNKKGKFTCSIYSTKDEIHCGEIAKKLGGGGHKGAAGFATDDIFKLLTRI